MKLYWHKYPYFDYEKEFSIREVKEVLKPKKIINFEDHILLQGSFERKQISKLVYFSKAELNGETIVTLQNNLEKNSCGYSKRVARRQSTRYAVHGVHSYKGKFNPQVVRGILNILNMKEDNNILDPFCGSGTSLVECYFGRYNCIGMDRNPLATFVANAKIETLRVSARELQKQGSKAIALADSKKGEKLKKDDSERGEYLKKWFPDKYLHEIEILKPVLDNLQYKNKNILYVIASDLLRNYSYQEPADLRIRKRFSEFPKESFYEAYLQQLNYLVNKLEGIPKSILNSKNKIIAKNVDSSKKELVKKAMSKKESIDAGITSPPYAMALPYIDTQRLSLVWLNLAKPIEIKKVDQELIGSREYINGDKNLWEEKLERNHEKLPDNLHSYCIELKKAISKSDGFRRRAVPSLLYRYLVGMRDVFKNIQPHFNKGAPFALIIGYNTTTLGGKQFSVNTPQFLLDLAVCNGWTKKEFTPLQTYKRYQLHKKNSINQESLIVVERK